VIALRMKHRCAFRLQNQRITELDVPTFTQSKHRSKSSQSAERP